MKYSQRLISIATLIGILALPISGASDSQLLSVGPNVNVSSSSPDHIHTEVVLGADPLDASRLIACGIHWRSGLTENSDTVVYMSDDGGLHWSQRFLMPGGNDPRVGSADPYCWYGTHHEALFMEHINMGADSYGSSTHGEGRMITRTFISKDDGATWEPKQTLPLADRPFVAVDREPGPTFGYMYAVLFSQENFGSVQPEYDHVSPLVIVRSTDGGASFLSWAQYANSEDDVAGGIDVLPSGRPIAAFSRQLRDKIGEPSKDEDRGSIDVVIPEYYADSAWASHQNAPITVSDLDGCGQESYPPFPSVAVDHSNGPFHGRAYVVWPDKRYGPCRILESYSDNGRTWSAPVVADSDRYWSAGGDDFHPRVVVNNKGVVGVSWQDRQEDTKSLGWRERFGASFDGGQSFSDSIAVGSSRMRAGDGSAYSFYTDLRAGSPGASRYKDAPITLSGSISGHPITGGETTGLAADANGVFHALWVDNRTGIHQIWTAPIRASGTVARNGSELEGWHNASSTLILHFGTSVMRVARHQLVIMHTKVYNAGKAPISGPIKVRVLDLTSPFGRVVVANGDNGKTGPGAIWTYGTQSGTALLPGQYTLEKDLVLTIHPPQSLLRFTQQHQYETIDPLSDFPLSAQLLVFAKNGS